MTQTYEAWRITYQSSEQAARAAFERMMELKSSKCLHQIAEPVAPVVKPIKDAIDALVMAAFTEGGCSEHRMSEARIQTELRKKELRTLLSTPQPCSRSHPHEEMTPMCELRTEIAQLTNALARAEAQLAAAPQAVQPAVPEGWVPCVITYEGQQPEEIAYGPQIMMDRLKKWLDRYFEMRTAPAHPAEGVPAPMPVAHPHHCTARTADGSCEECEGHAQAMAEWNTERAALAATQPAAQGMDAQMLNFINDKRVALTPEYEGPWKAEVFADEAEPVITTEGSTVRDAVSAAIAAKAKQGE